MSNAQKTVPDRNVTTLIDADRCVGCGLCTVVCPMATLIIEGGKAIVRGTDSLNCDHCAAACPTEAIHLIRKQQEELIPPVKDEMDWMEQRARERGVDFSAYK